MSCKNCENSPYPGGAIAYCRFHTSDDRWVNVGVEANGLCREHLWEAMGVLQNVQGIARDRREIDPVMYILTEEDLDGELANE